MTIEEVVPRVTIWRGQETRVSSLSGGLTNDNYLVEAGGVRYVVRIPGRSTELLAIDRANEHANAGAAAQAGVGPAVLEYLPDVEVMVLEFIPGETMSGETLRSTRMARRMAASIRDLHAGPRFLRDFDMFRLTERYLAICNRRGFRTPAGFHERMATVAAVEGALRAQPLQTVPCHNDLLAGNFIAGESQLWIVDWEYAGMGDRYFDLANFAVNNELGEAGEVALLSDYFSESPTARRVATLRLMKFMSDFREAMWGVVQSAVSELDFDFGEYRDKHFDRMLSTAANPDFDTWLREASEPAR